MTETKTPKLCRHCGQPATMRTKAGWHIDKNMHIWRDAKFIVRDEACEAALDGYLPGMNAGQVWAFRTGWELSADHLSTELAAAKAEIEHLENTAPLRREKLQQLVPLSE